MNVFLNGYCDALCRVGLRKVAEELIAGGKAEGEPASKYPAEELAMGKKVEKEHTPDVGTATEIAKDHLEEFPEYYTALHKMEKKLDEKKASVIASRVIEKLAEESEEEEKAEEEGNPITMEQVREFFRQNQTPEDSEFHSWAEGLGVSPHAAEELAYQLAAQQVTGQPPQDLVEGGTEE